MDDDTAAAEHGGWIGIVRGVELVVVNQAGAVAPNPESYLVLTVTAIDRRQLKPITAAAIDRAGACVLRPVRGNHQRVVTRALEIQIAGIELKPGITDRDRCSRLVSRDKAEASLAAGSGHLDESTRR